MSPKISVIVATFNYAKYLPRAIDSLLKQGLPKDEYEIIVVDDGSTDNTQKILEKYSEKVSVIRKEKNEGLPAACNSGIRASRGEYIIRCDADDTSESNLLSGLSSVLDNNPGAGFSYCDYNIITPDGKSRRVSLKKFEFFKMIATNTMFRKSGLEKSGLYSEMFFEEYDLLARYMKLFEGVYVNISPVNYHKHGEGMTEDKKKWEAGLVEFRKKHKNFITKHKLRTPQYTWEVK